MSAAVRVLPLGPVMIDVAGTELTDDDRARLLHPACGGVILFARNYASRQQLAQLCAQVRALRSPALPIGVDHEGGRVQRFRDGFLPLPPMRLLGQCWDHDAAAARRSAEQVGFALAADLRVCGVDFSFTPVLDLDFGRSGVIGDRAFHGNPHAVGELAAALIHGMARAGMASVGKHFPGHGYAQADSHTDVPVDERGFAAIDRDDLHPYRYLAQRGLTAVMPAHVIYPAVDAAPAGFSRRWLVDVLRARIGFDGAVLSDDLAMEGASVAGDAPARARAALAAGCDMVLVCNRPDLADQVLHSALPGPSPASARRVAALRGARFALTDASLHASARWQTAREAVERLLAGDR